MDDNFEEKADEFANKIEDAAEQADEQIEKAVENIGDRLEEAGETVKSAWEQTEETVQETIESTWEHVEEVQEDSIEFIEPAPEADQAAWSEVTPEPVDDVSQTSEEAQKKHEHTYNDEFVPDESDECCEPQVIYDPLAAAEWGSSQVNVGSGMAGPTITAKDVRAIKADNVVDTERKAANETNDKKDFPVWAIVLIIVLLLCICIMLPILFVGAGLIAIIRSLISTTLDILPYLFM